MKIHLFFVILLLSACADEAAFDRAWTEFEQTGKTSWTGPKNRDGSPAKSALCSDKAQTNYTFPRSAVCRPKLNVATN